MEAGKLYEIIVSSDEIDDVYATGSTPNLTLSTYPVNSYFVLRSDTESQKTALVRFGGRDFHRVNTKKHQKENGISPKDVKQLTFSDSLHNRDILVSVGIGAAGTGKTTLALAYAIQQYQDHERKIFLTKPATFIGSAKAFGPVPGDVKEKYAPFLASYDIVLKKLLGNRGEQAMEQMLKKEFLKFIPIEYARGCTFEDCTFIIDEAQNLTWHELNSIVSRVGERSKLILLGDPNQIDIRAKVDETGLAMFCDSPTFLASPITSAVQLTEQYRSKIAELVINIDKEIREKLDGPGTKNSRDYQPPKRRGSQS